MKVQNYDTVSVGLRIKKSRDHLQMTQENLGENIGVGPQHISDVERGTVGISIGTLIKFCDALNVTADYILFGEDVTHSGVPVYEAINDMTTNDKIFIEELLELCIKKLKQK